MCILDLKFVIYSLGYIECISVGSHGQFIEKVGPTVLVLHAPYTMIYEKGNDLSANFDLAKSCASNGLIHGRSLFPNVV